MNMILFESKFPMINIRYSKRAGYYSALERSSLSESPDPSFSGSSGATAQVRHGGSDAEKQFEAEHLEIPSVG